MRRAGNKPFAPVEHPLVAIPVDARLQIGRVARRDVGLRHGKGASDLALKQGAQPTPALLRRGKQMQQLHVAGVGCAAVEDFRGPGHASHDLGQRRVVQIAQAQTRLILTQAGQKEIPQAF